MECSDDVVLTIGRLVLTIGRLVLTIGRLVLTIGRLVLTIVLCLLPIIHLSPSASTMVLYEGYVQQPSSQASCHATI